PGLRHLDLDEVAERAEEGIDPFAGFGPSSADAALAPYRAKRDAARTPEPVPERTAVTAAGPLPRFVIQEHHAHAKHFDLRIEHD
ncbi:hypothetical protein U8M34_28180, partial [Klebsiella pneumoniae]